jgi:hypothetical protein
VPKRSFRVGRSRAGLGLFATKKIKKGAFVVAYTGPRISNAESARRERRGARYMFEINRRWTIDGSSRKNLARYVNHACRPNARAVLRKGRIVYVALRNIAPEREITVDYGEEYFDYFLKKTGCLCAACATKQDVRKSKRTGKLKPSSSATARASRRPDR